MDAIHYYSLDNKYLYELAKFVVEENYNHHAPSESMEFQDEVNLVYAEEEQLNNSKIFAAKNDNKLHKSVVYHNLFQDKFEL